MLSYFFSHWQSLLSSLANREKAQKTLSRRGLYKLALQDLETLTSLAKTMGYVRILACVVTCNSLAKIDIVQAEEQAQALDPNGRRYLLAFSGHIENLSETTYEEATWALHSQSKTVCLQTVISQCPNQLILWSDVQRHKLSFWVEDAQIVCA